MAEINSRIESSCPQVTYYVLHIPTDADLSTGEFRIRLKNDVAEEQKLFSVWAIHPPQFRVTAVFNVSADELWVSLSMENGRNPLSSRLFLLQETEWRTTSSEMVISYKNWIATKARIGSLEISSCEPPNPQCISPQWKSISEEAGATGKCVFKLESTEIVDNKAFSEEEKKAVQTCVGFDLPWAIPGLQGPLPTSIPFKEKRKGQVLLQTRQKDIREIASVMGLPSQQNVPPGTIFVCTDDRHGRVNVSSLQFQFDEYVEAENRGELFAECLRWFNRFIEHYRKCTDRFELRKVSAADLIVYVFAHIYAGRCYNRVVVPACRYYLEAAPFFDNDEVLWQGINSSSEVRLELWERLLLEAKHYLAINDNRIAVVNAITALENIVKESSGRHLKHFVTKHGVSLDLWKNNDKLDSLTICLNLLHVLQAQLELPEGLTSRLFDHYNRRNNIVHNGALNVSVDQASSAVEDVYYLARCLFARFDFTLSIILRPGKLLTEIGKVELICVTSGSNSLIMWIDSGRLSLNVQKAESEGIHIGEALPETAWKAGQRISLAMSYNHEKQLISLMVGDRTIKQTTCKLDASFDSAKFRGHSWNDDLLQIIIEPALIQIHQRAVPPEDFCNLEGVYQV